MRRLLCFVRGHRWRLHSHRVSRWSMRSVDPNEYRYGVTAVLQCGCCRRRRFLEHAVSAGWGQLFCSEESAMMWLRSHCADPVPDRLPEQIGVNR